MSNAIASWDVYVSYNMPQKVATAVGKLADTLVGADYQPIAYLGSQTVNGTNHAVLAEQTVLTGRDSKNIVVLIFNEKPSDIDLTLVAVERVVEGGDTLGGVAVDVQTELSEEVKTLWADAFKGFVGSEIKPFAYLGSQTAKGVNHIFAATAKAVSPNAANEAVLVVVNAVEKTVKVVDLLANQHAAAFGYSFNWLKTAVI